MVLEGGRDMDPSLALGAALLLGQRGLTAPVLGLLAFAASAYLLRRRLGRGWWGVLALVTVGSAWRSHATFAAHEETRHAVRRALGAPARCEGSFVVTSSPVRKGAALRFDGTFDQLVCEDRPVGRDVRARLYAEGFGDFARGDRAFVIAGLAAVEPFVNPDLPDPRPVMARSRVTLSGSVVGLDARRPNPWPTAWIDRARNAVRHRIEATYAPAAAPLGRALVLGETDLQAEDDAAFRNSGLSHLLAVSGTHLVLAVAGFAKLLVYLLGRSEAIVARTDPARPAAWIAAPLAFVYADFAGGSGSATRAATMMAVLFAATALGRRGSAIRALGLSMCLGAVVDPLAAYDLSFLLSLAATSGLMMFARPLEAWLLDLSRGRGAIVIGPMSTTLAATLACTPLLATTATTLPLLGVLANLVAVPIGELCALPACLAHTAVAAFPPLERGLAALGSGALLALRAVALIASRGAAPMPPIEPAGLLALAVAVMSCKLHPQRRGLVALVLALALTTTELEARLRGSPRDRVRATHLDVGQGDAAIVDLPDGNLMLIDGGGFVGSPVDPGTSVILPTLRARRRSRVDVVVLSHPHPDHFLGLVSALPKLDVGELWDTGQGEEEGAGPAYRALLDGLRARGIPVLRPADLCGKPRAYGDATIEVLAPCPQFRPLRNPNDNSLVVRVARAAHAALFVGDAEHEEEAELVARYGDALRADVLKVGHHGSRTSTTDAFLDAVRPRTVVISTGLRNRFGHPHPKTLGTLARHGIAPLRTDERGGVVWEFAE